MKAFRTFIVGVLACLASTAVAAEPFNGLYIGAHAGGDFGKIGVEGPIGIDGLAATGGLVGVHVGYDFRVPGSQFVVGAGADYDWSNAKFEVSPGLLSAQMGDSWTVYGRVGVVLNEKVMPYVLAGYTEGTGKATLLGGYGGPTFSQDMKGWVAGGGVEFYLTPMITMSGEYRFTKYDSIDLGSGFSLDTERHIVRAALNFRLDGSNPFAASTLK
jgi:outer membrane immunogenic protein